MRAASQAVSQLARVDVGGSLEVVGFLHAIEEYSESQTTEVDLTMSCVQQCDNCKNVVRHL
jgi:hypothetical protein